jgi:PAS domain S-box-containing protein
MNNSIILDLFQNIAILLAFSMLYNYFWAPSKNTQNFFYKFGAGIITGGIGIILILTPWTYKTGIIFDTRSIILAITGLFFGFVPTVVSILIVSIYRIALGGQGVYMGVAVIILSGTAGILWHHFRPDWNKRNQIVELIGLGLIVHILMICCTQLLPIEVRRDTLENIFLPVLIIYPIATVLLGKLMIQQAQNWENIKALDISEKRWQFALEGAGEGVWDWNTQSNEVFYSKKWKSMLGYSENEITNVFASWENLIHPDDRSNTLTKMSQLISGETLIYIAEYRLLCKNGSYKWILSRGIVMSRDENGNPIRCIGTHKDISDRKFTEQALKESESYTNSILKAIPDLIFIFDSNGVYLDFKTGNTEDLALPENLFLNKNIFEVLPETPALLIKNKIDFVIQHQTTSSVEYQIEILEKKKDYECIIVPFGPMKVIAMVRNITQRKQVEAELKSSQEQLKNFAAHLQFVREEERVLLAREIHDELGQILIAMKIDIGMIKQHVVKAVDKKIIEDVNSKFEQLNKLIDNTISTTRKIMTGLRSEVLELLGFQESVNLYILEFTERFQIDCTFESSDTEIRIDSQQSIALFRILQEALTNIAKHAKATEVQVSLSITDEKLIMKISDNGIGFDKHKKIRSDSYGLIGMKERVFLLDGKLSITGHPGQGTVLLIEMPYVNQI